MSGIGSNRCAVLLGAIMIVAGIAPFGSAARGAEASAIWLTGAALQKRLAEPVGVDWSDTPLRQAVRRLCHTQRVPVLIDRRVDPGQTLDLSLSGQPLEEVFRQIAATRGLGLSWLGGVAYLGPTAAARKIRTLAELRREELDRLPAVPRRTFLLRKPARWDDFATPRDLLGDLAADAQIEIAGVDLVPHDLWAGAELPPMTLVDRLTLIAGQFDLTFQAAADGRAVALVPIPDEVAIERRYPGGSEPRKLAEKWAELVPESRVEVAGDQVVVRGLLEDHERVRQLARPERWRPTGVAGKGEPEELHTLRTSAPLGQLLEYLAQRLELDLRIDHQALRQAGISLENPVSCKVEEATLDELLQTVLTEAGCTFQRRGKVVEIRPGR